MFAALEQRFRPDQEFLRLAVLRLHFECASITRRCPLELTHGSIGIAQQIMRRSIVWVIPYGPRQCFKGQVRPNGFEVTDAQLAPSLGVLLVLSEEVTQDLNRLRKVRAIQSLDSAGESLFGLV